MKTSPSIERPEIACFEGKRRRGRERKKEINHIKFMKEEKFSKELGRQFFNLCFVQNKKQVKAKRVRGRELFNCFR